MERATVHVDGIVQSVGFRPFVYRTATGLDLTGTVRNLGDAGVRIELEGSTEQIDAFLEALRHDNPPLAEVQTVDVEREAVDEASFSTFEILESQDAGEGSGTIPPDTAMCEACLADMRDPQSRYHEYWATSCVDCGPRFTVIHDLPYDRPKTSMAAFPMCEACREEYEDPADRRHHAQTIACPDCGPGLTYSEAFQASAESQRPGVDTRDPFPPNEGRRLDGQAAIQAAAELLEGGGIVVVKGIGGAHLACDATNRDAVARLRERTDRPAKPFAVMAPDLDAVDRFARPDPTTRDALASPRRPILLVPQRSEAPIAANEVAPGLHTVGVMLAYSGLHHLLFNHVEDPLVMTSANLPGRPMHVHNAEIAEHLVEVADGLLLHDRTIVARCDDSVGRRVAGGTRWLRRSRGHVPVPVDLPGAGSEARVLALGPELDVVAGLLDGEECYLTQYVGHVDDPATFAYLKRAIGHLRSLTQRALPETVACDLHPGFETSRYAQQLLGDETTPVERVVEVQHHHAHAASVLAEHDLEAAVAITVDGVGYGPDETVWGGEVLEVTCSTFERVGGLAPVPMPGGDRATRYPDRMLAGLLAGVDRGGLEAMLETHARFPEGAKERDLVLQQIAQDVNTPTTTSAGRFLDAIAALVDACHKRTYEGEPAMRLEGMAVRGEPLDLEVPTTEIDARRVVDTPELTRRLVDRYEAGASPADVAATAQHALASGLARLAIDEAHEIGRDTVALSGGVAYNGHIHERIRELVEDAGLSFATNEKVPPGDGGIAYGQAAVAASSGTVYE